MEQLLMRLQSMIERLRLRHILNDDESKEGHGFITVIGALLTTEKYSCDRLFRLLCVAQLW